MDIDQDALKLWLTPGLGNAKNAKLLAHFGSLASAINAKPSDLAYAGLSSQQIDFLHSDTSTDLLNQHLEWMNASNYHHIITLGSSSYPTRLMEIPRPPLVLCIKGNLNALHDPQLGMIGSRNPTQTGKDTAFQFAKHLSHTGITITSGLALGIDGESHKGAIAAQGPTIAVVGTGLNRVYPAAHKSLAQDIISSHGALVSEYPLESNAHASHFPQRNRIISGLSLGTLVVEAAIKSGSLITARFAQEQGREVFAIPGSIHNPLAKGCHLLIKQGAKLVETADDLLEELAPQLQDFIQHTTPSLEPNNTAKTNTSSFPSEFTILLDAMDYTPITLDDLSSRTQIPSHELASTLLIMELEGLVSSEAGGCYMRRKTHS